jgi:UDP-2,4-diacetamido-2,4,6-trideoxy-beta-L-altropyranose hydrolase
MGHLVRTYALARELARRGVSLLFATASENAERWLRARSAEVARVDAEPGSLDDAVTVTRLARERQAGTVVTDGHAFREAFLQALVDTGLPVASVDDLAAWSFPSSFVVNGGLGSKALRYRTAPATRLLVGPEYLLLRPEFVRPQARVRSSVERVLLCFGGADPEDLTGQTVEAWSRLEDPPELDVLVGAAYPHLDDLNAQIPRSRARIHSDLDGPALADLMVACDMAIASAGMVACELVALGVPSIVVVSSEDQRANAAALAESAAALVQDTTDVETLVRAARRLAVHEGLRREIGLSARRLVDGYGAARVAEALIGELQ